MTAFKARTGFISLVLACAFGGIVVRLFVIQILDGEFYAQQSKKQIQQRALLPAQRGNILDRKGMALATNVESRLEVNTLIDSEPQPPGSAAAGRQKGFFNVKRLYPYGECAGAVLGYVGNDGSGLGGAEFYFNRFLKGEDGWSILSRDAKNNKYAKINLPSKLPRSGSDVYLTLDLDIQKIVENALQQAVEQLKASGGMCVIEEPETGNILAMASEPSFNPNLAVRYALGQRLNKCINYTYEPGSTFKVLTAACALQEKIIKETDTLDGNGGYYEVYEQKIRDKRAYGRLSFLEAFKYSSNVCFAKVANNIANDRFYSYIKDFGFGAQTGIQLPGEEIGIVRPINKWSGRSRVTIAIGQEISVTLLQMAMLFSAIANEGILVEPRMYEKIVDADGSVVDSARYKPLRRVISQETADRLKSMMCDVVKKGTGTKAAIKGIAIAGKTGTAQKIDKTTGAYSDKRGWASFIGFLPADRPMLLGAVVIDEPANAEMGGSAAAPVFQKIMSQIISHPQLEFAEKILRGPLPDVADGRENRSVPDAFLDSGKKLTMYTCPPAMADKNPGMVMVPLCVGKDLRDAVNSLNLKGLVPHIRGAGIVRGQSPRPGAFVKHAERCTLSCTFGNLALSGAPAR